MVASSVRLCQKSNNVIMVIGIIILMTQNQETLPPLVWLRAFEAAARRSSFTLAADELGLTQAAISQQIRALESRLGAALFHRRQRGVILTPEGSAYLPHV